MKRGTEESDPKRRRTNRFSNGKEGANGDAAAGNGSSKAERAALIQKQIQEQISSVSKALAANKARGPSNFSSQPPPRAVTAQASFMPAPLMLDEEGREIDEDGALVVKEKGSHSMLKANIRAQKKKENPYLAHKRVEDKDKMSQYDGRVRKGRRQRQGKKRGKEFKFVREGTFAKQGERMRIELAAGIIAAEQRAKKGSETSGTLSFNQMDSALGMTYLGEEKDDAALPPHPETKVPVMEWWDAAFLPKEKRNAPAEGDWAALSLGNSASAKMVEHPVPIDPLGIKTQPQVMKIMLTKKERKRIRRLSRMEREKEKNEKIRLGLIPAPKPKVKISNLMRVLGQQAVQDPSRVEKEVRQSVEQRIRNHEMRNQARKKTPQERKDKKKAKLQEDTDTEVVVALFRVPSLTDPQKRFKIDVNAQQSMLTGQALVLKTGDCNLVVVEGGPKSIRRFIRLMCQRMNWDTEADEVDSEEDEHAARTTAVNRGCQLVWSGSVHKRTFKKFRFEECRAASNARKVMQSRGVVHYWDMVYRHISA